MRIAIVCDWLVTIAGAENVLREILSCFPQADLFAVIDFLNHDQRDFLLGKTAQTTFIQKLPFAKKYYRYYLPLMPLAIEQLDLSAYQLIISNAHAVAKGVITGPDQLHISYVHSPMRYAWDLQHQYLRESRLKNNPLGLVARYALHKLRLWDLRTAPGVDYFICNSNYIARRINKIYRREAKVIYPPVDLTRFVPGDKLPGDQAKDNYYMTASRLVPYKKIDLIIESFRHLPNKQLVVIGDGPDFAKLKNKAGANVTMLGFQSDEVLIQHLQRAKAFIFAAEEDFGILPLEAQACGTPIIAFGKGGALETVRGYPENKPTGLFFHEQTTTALCQAIENFERQQPLFTIENCIQQASQFSTIKFRETFKNYVEQCVHSCHPG